MEQLRGAGSDGIGRNRLGVRDRKADLCQFRGRQGGEGHRGSVEDCQTGAGFNRVESGRNSRGESQLSHRAAGRQAVHGKSENGIPLRASAHKMVPAKSLRQ